MNHANDRINDYIATVAARLPGPAKTRADLLAELRDGLTTARELNECAGMNASEAVGDALCQYGDPQTLARLLLPELTMAGARRTVVALFSTAPIIAAIWLPAARTLPDHRSSSLLSGAATHAPALLLFCAMLACGTWTLAITGRATRWLNPSLKASLLGASATAAITAFSDLAGILLFTTLLARASGTAERLTIVTAILASTIRLALASRASRTYLRSRTTTTATATA